MKVSSQIKPLMRAHAEDTPTGVRLWVTAAGMTQEQITIPEDVFMALVVNAHTLAQHIETKRQKVAA